ISTFLRSASKRHKSLPLSKTLGEITSATSHTHSASASNRTATARRHPLRRQCLHRKSHCGWRLTTIVHLLLRARGRNSPCLRMHQPPQAMAPPATPSVTGAAAQVV
ncbi:hypothetical protein V8G54_019320, partial [Vigna mungo]